jgi:putative N6-adenine-specific DNA methylase
VLLHRFPAPGGDPLYTGALEVPWERFISPDRTLSVSAVCRGSAVQHSNFAALKVKDAVCDRLRTHCGSRPTVSRDDPDVRVNLYLANDKASLYLDLSGEPLHRRGYRTEAGEAPLRETLAAVMLRLSGWNRATPLVDPMCGSGTIAIEAAQWATNHAPGLDRERFGFERWASFGDEQAEQLRALRGALRRAVRPTRPRIVAADLDAGMLDLARANARRAHVKLSFRQQSFLDFQSGGAERGVLVTNPPYGRRLEKEPGLVRGIAAAISRLHGWRVCLLAGSPDYERSIPIRPLRTIMLSNGPIECALLVYDVP